MGCDSIPSSNSERLQGPDKGVVSLISKVGDMGFEAGLLNKFG